MGTINYYKNVHEIPQETVKYDYVIFDKEEQRVDRKEFAQTTQYQLSEILHVEFLYDGGYYSRY